VIPKIFISLNDSKGPWFCKWFQIYLVLWLIPKILGFLNDSKVLFMSFWGPDSHSMRLSNCLIGWYYKKEILALNILNYSLCVKFCLVQYYSFFRPSEINWSHLFYYSVFNFMILNHWIVHFFASIFFCFRVIRYRFQILKYIIGCVHWVYFFKLIVSIVYSTT